VRGRGPDGCCAAARRILVGMQTWVLVITLVVNSQAVGITSIPGDTSEAACHSAGVVAQNSERTEGRAIQFFCLVGLKTPRALGAGWPLSVGAHATRRGVSRDASSYFAFLLTCLGARLDCGPRPKVRLAHDETIGRSFQ
jgi:hypothetical protein